MLVLPILLSLRLLGQTAQQTAVPEQELDLCRLLTSCLPILLVDWVLELASKSQLGYCQPVQRFLSHHRRMHDGRKPGFVSEAGIPRQI